MADKSPIEWTDATWNPVVGCSVVSPGCTNCYAMKMAGRLEAMGSPIYAGHTTKTKAGFVWNGKVSASNWGQVIKPLSWRTPRRIFVNSMSDLFHPDLSIDTVAEVFGVMAVAGQPFYGPGGIGMRVGTVYPKGEEPRPIRSWGTKFGPHIFQVLTKRADHMRDLLNSGTFRSKVAHAAHRHAHDRVCAGGLSDAIEGGSNWPLPNVWLGTSVEDAPRKSRIDELRATPAAIRFLSLEPLLGDLGTLDLTGISWVIAGGESGPGARPMHADWARSIRDQCAAAGVAFFHKQNGAFVGLPEAFDHGITPGHIARAEVATLDGLDMIRVGKKAAGRLLDGRTHDAFPEIRS